jgi:hypothetical protein
VQQAGKKMEINLMKKLLLSKNIFFSVSCCMSDGQLFQFLQQQQQPARMNCTKKFNNVNGNFLLPL